MYTNKTKINCHIELSNFCNAACPMCGRNTISSKPPYEMRIRKDVDDSQITISDFKKKKPDYHFTILNEHEAMANALTHYFDSHWNKGKDY